MQQSQMPPSMPPPAPDIHGKGYALDEDEREARTVLLKPETMAAMDAMEAMRATGCSYAESVAMLGPTVGWASACQVLVARLGRGIELAVTCRDVARAIPPDDRPGFGDAMLASGIHPDSAALAVLLRDAAGGGREIGLTDAFLKPAYDLSAELSPELPDFAWVGTFGVDTNDGRTYIRTHMDIPSGLIVPCSLWIEMSPRRLETWYRGVPDDLWVLDCLKVTTPSADEMRDQGLPWLPVPFGNGIHAGSLDLLQCGAWDGALPHDLTVDDDEWSPLLTPRYAGGIALWEWRKFHPNGEFFGGSGMGGRP